MNLGRVVGSVVSTIKKESFGGKKLMIVQPVNVDGTDAQESDFIAIDIVTAGIGDIVLVNKEGGSARIYLNEKEIPVQAVIVGIIDKIDLGEKN
ncbi:EutN/CcmL family microcompartment protein [bacterium]|nr:EutN/CcmL family microcompartment protein [bacterium]